MYKILIANNCRADPGLLICLLRVRKPLLFFLFFLRTGGRICNEGLIRRRIWLRLRYTDFFKYVAACIVKSKDKTGNYGQV